MRNSNNLPKPSIFLTLIVGLLLAFYLGRLAGNGDFKKITLILSAIGGVVLCLKMQRHIWLIIPITSGLTGSLTFLPLPFSLSEISVMVVFVMFMFFIIFKMLRTKVYYEFVDVVMFANLAWLATVYIRNPVGIDALGADLVGGKPYFVVVISVIFYWIYNKVRVKPDFILTYVLLCLSGQFLQAGLNFITTAVPALAVVIYPFYTGVNLLPVVDSYSTNSQGDSDGPVRSPYSAVGFNSLLALMSYLNPITLMSPLYFGRFLAALISFMAVLSGGFRSIILHCTISFLIISTIKGGLELAVRAMLIGGAVLAIVICLQGNFINLPWAAQRSLSFLPGNWDEGAVGDAKSSSEWRFKMWKDILKDNKYIKSWWFGDGFGFSRTDLNFMKEVIVGDAQGEETESQKISGAYHSGPLSAIRYAGVIGLILYLTLSCCVSLYGWRLVKRAKDTPYFPWALIACVPALWEPINYIFIFGGYDGSLPGSIMTLGIMKLISASLRDYQNEVAIDTKVVKAAITSRPRKELATAG